MNRGDPHSEDSLPLTQQQQVDHICDAFERAWLDDPATDLEEFLNRAATVERSYVLRELIATHVELRRQRGETPSPADYLPQFAEFEGVVAAAFAIAASDGSRSASEFVSSESDAGQGGAPASDKLSSDRGEDDVHRHEMPEWIGGRFRIEKELGQGGFAVVYLALDTELDRLVALKVPLMNGFRDESEIGRFLHEARTAARFQHPRIVPIYDVQREGDQSVYIVQQYIEGQDLATAARVERFSVSRVVELMIGIAEAVGFAHQQQIVHRDLKPANILLDACGSPHVADFGLAVHADLQRSRAGERAGTAAYMSPEQVRGEVHRLDGRSDIWSLGVIFYELLTGMLPFSGGVVTLFDEIEHREPRPPRQVNPSVPLELARICGKCLAKRAADRYSAATDLIEDLRSWQTQAAGAAHERAPATESDPEAVLIPRGLRSFTAADADSFLALLPGIRDREGLPECVRFWKSRVEEKDADETFPVGLIYGPSGCGKTSLVRAGLIPRLASSIQTVYVESTGYDTEVRLLKALRKLCADAAPDASLPETIATLRLQAAASGRKVVIVLDQFEQWLHATGSLRDGQLTAALRQCDGGGVQCLLMIRDDFWMSATRLMHALEIPLVEGGNSAAVDLFDLDHARHVLAALGHAYGKLQSPPGEPDDAEERFLEKAVAGLADQGRVVCVRLAVFAEMMKSRPWTETSLRDLGGPEGVGVTFLEETFAARTAPPAHRFHEAAIRAVLKGLLPELGSTLKGQMKSYDELLELSGYADRPDQFHAVLAILDGDVRLITPTEPDEASLELDDRPAGRPEFFQLTHDFLVVPLRDWLAVKQQATWSGRAAVRLEKRAADWAVRREDRHLPAWWEYAGIRLGTRKIRWTATERDMMRRAGRVHRRRIVVAAMIAVLVVWTAYEVRGRMLAAAVVSNIMNAQVENLPAIVGEVDPLRTWVDPKLQELLTIERLEPRQELNVRLALLPTDPSQQRHLHDRLLRGTYAEMPTVVECLRRVDSGSAERIRQSLHDDRLPAEQRLRAGVAVVNFRGAEHGLTDDEVSMLAETLLNADSADQTVLRELLKPIKASLIPLLRERYFDEQEDAFVSEAAAAALSEYLADAPAELADLASCATAGQYEFVAERLISNPTHHGAARAALVALADRQPDATADAASRLKLGRSRAGAAITLLHLNAADEARRAFKIESDPESITQFVHRCRSRRIKPTQLLAVLDGAAEVHERFAILLALGEFRWEELPDQRRAELKANLVGWYGSDPSAAIHGACGWLLRRWGFAETVTRVDQTPIALDPTGRREWFVEAYDVAGHNQKLYFTFIVIKPGETTIGSPQSEPGRSQIGEPLRQVTLTHPLAVSDREVTWQQFMPMIGIKQWYASVRAQARWKASADEPLVGMSWYEAVMCCRWVTVQAGMGEDQQCYLDPRSQSDRELDERNKVCRFLTTAPPRDWAFDFSRPGFRLLTDTEWECVARSGMGTPYSFGSSKSLLPNYGWTIQNADEMPHDVGQLRPSLGGLFDIHGNLLEWCHDWHQPEPLAWRPETATGPATGAGRAVRGGGWGLTSRHARSAMRGGTDPRYRSDAVGFRIVRRIRLDELD